MNPNKAFQINSIILQQETVNPKSLLRLCLSLRRFQNIPYQTQSRRTVFRPNTLLVVLLKDFRFLNSQLFYFAGPKNIRICVGIGTYKIRG